MERRRLHRRDRRGWLETRQVAAGKCFVERTSLRPRRRSLAAIRTIQDPTNPRRNPMDRRSILSISAIAASGLAMLPGSAVGQQRTLKEQLVGSWTLVSTEVTQADGRKRQDFGTNPKGI